VSTTTTPHRREELQAARTRLRVVRARAAARARASTTIKKIKTIQTIEESKA